MCPTYDSREQPVASPRLLCHQAFQAAFLGLALLQPCFPVPHVERGKGLAELIGVVLRLCEPRTSGDANAACGRVNVPGQNPNALAWKGQQLRPWACSKRMHMHNRPSHAAAAPLHHAGRTCWLFVLHTPPFKRRYECAVGEQHDGFWRLVPIGSKPHVGAVHFDVLDQPASRAACTLRGAHAQTVQI